MRVECPTCLKPLQVNVADAGKIAACPCGAKFKIPIPPAKKAPAAKITTTCPSCNRTLTASSSSRGKTLKCPCGTAFRLGGQAASSPTPVADSDPFAGSNHDTGLGDDVWGNLPANSAPAAQQPAYPQSSYQPPASSYQPTGYSVSATGISVSNQHQTSS